jgi:hypothetical protein
MDQSQTDAQSHLGTEQPKPDENTDPSDTKNNQAAEQKFNIEDIVKQVQNFAAAFAASGTMIAVSGFIVLHSHLARYTDMPLIGIPLQFYLMAGFALAVVTSFLFLSMWIGWKIGELGGWVATKPVESIPNIGLRRFAAVVLTIIYLGIVALGIHVWPALPQLAGLIFVPYVLLVLVYFASIPKPTKLTWWQHFQTYLLDPRLLLFSFYKSLATAVALFLYFAFYIGLISSVYGAFFYSTVPLIFNGGQPSSINLVFRDGVTVDRFNLSGADQETTQICLLAPIAEGLLIYDPSKKVVVTIPNEFILSIRDDQTTVDCNP